MKPLPLLTILCLLSGCASTQTLAVPVCPKAAPLTPEMRIPAPAPGLFERCMGEVVAYGEGQGQISPDCSALLRDGQTK